jgi:hypothetical protein
MDNWKQPVAYVDYMFKRKDGMLKIAYWIRYSDTDVIWGSTYTPWKQSNSFDLEVYARNNFISGCWLKDIPFDILKKLPAQRYFEARILENEFRNNM